MPKNRCSALPGPSPLKMSSRSTPPADLLTADSHEYSPDVCVRAVLTLQRRYFGMILKTYLPTACLIVIVYLTNFYKENHFDTAMMVSLTGRVFLLTLSL